MRMIISPAKKMVESEDLSSRSVPVFAERSRTLLSYLKSLDYQDLRKLLCCNDRLAGEAFHRYEVMDSPEGQSPALLSYDGIQYTYMAPRVFEEKYYEYVTEHLRILSGFYGLLRPLDGIRPYRLEMQARLKTPFCSSLYDFWGDSLYKEVVKGDGVILNLASEEYARCIRRYVTPEVTFHDCRFAFREGDKLVEKGVYCKMARGEMVRYCAENGIDELSDIRGFDRLGFSFSEEESSEKESVFIKG